MKPILAIIALAFAFTLGACSSTCPASKATCCSGDTCATTKHTHAKKE